MRLYLNYFITTCSLLLVLLLVIGIEQVRGIPILYLSLSLLWLEKRPLWQQIMGGIVVGLIVSTTYMFSFTFGVALLFGLLSLFHSVRTTFASQTTGLLIAATLGAMAVGIVGKVALSWILLIAVAISLGLAVAISKLSSTHHVRRAHL